MKAVVGKAPWAVSGATQAWPHGPVELEDLEGSKHRIHSDGPLHAHLGRGKSRESRSRMLISQLSRPQGAWLWQGRRRVDRLQLGGNMRLRGTQPNDGCFVVVGAYREVTAAQLSAHPAKQPGTSRQRYLGN